MLSQKCPDSIAQEQPDYNSWCKRLILFCSSVHDGLCCPTPPGLWSYLLSHIMNTVKEVKNILSDQVPIEDDLVISTNIQRNNTNASDTILIYSNGYGGVSKSTKPSLAMSRSFPTKY